MLISQHFLSHAKGSKHTQVLFRDSLYTVTVYGPTAEGNPLVVW